jgi:acyl carrier protein
MSDASNTSTADVVKDYILREFLPGEDRDALTDATALITTGILDSVATLKLVSFLEEEFTITLEAHEADVEFLNTIADIVQLIERKQRAK